MLFQPADYVDSLRYSGRVIMANNGKSDSSLIAMLHTNLDDSAVAKERPRYIARLDSSGHFTFNNVHPGVYALYALKDESGTHEYTTKAQTFAFADSPVDLRKNTTPLLLYAYADTSDYKTKPKKAPVAPVAPKKEKEDKEKPKHLIISSNLQNSQLDLHQQLELSFAVPLKYYDSSKIGFTTDTSYKEITDFHYELDSLNKKLTFHYNWKENTLYHLILQKDFAQDTLGEKLLKIDTVTFRTKKETDYGNLRLRFRNLDLSRHPVLLFMQSNEKIFLSYPITRSLRYNNKLFDPGEYELRILYDTNQNGVWDPGNFYKHLQPEIVIPIKKKLYVKSDWDNEVDISL